MDVGIYRIVDHVRPLLNMLAACLAVKTLQRSCNPKISSIGGEAVSGNPHSMSTEYIDLLAGGTGADAVLCFGQADDTSGIGDTHTLLKSERVGLPGEDLTMRLCGQHP